MLKIRFWIKKNNKKTIFLYPVSGTWNTLTVFLVEE